MDAIVFQLAPRLDSVRPVGCLEPVAGRPLLRQVVDHLRQRLPSNAFSLVVLAGGPQLLADVKAAVEGSDAVVVDSQQAPALEALSRYCRSHPEVRNVLLLPEASVLPDAPLLQDALRFHAKNNAEVTYAPDLPAGLLADILQSRALLRLGDMGLPPDLGADIMALIRKANELFIGDAKMSFRTQVLQVSDFEKAIDIERLPAAFEVIDGLTRDSAAATWEDSPGDGLKAAYRFKEHLLRLQAVPPPPLVIPKRSGAVPILFSTVYTAFSGAEESFYLLIRELMSRFSPVAVLPKEGMLADKLRAAGLSVSVARQDLRPVTPALCDFFVRTLQEGSIRLVHTNGEPPPALAAAARYLRIPLVCHVRNFHGRRAPAGFQFADRLICVSEAVAADLRRSNIEPRRVMAVHNGIDLTRFDPSRVDRAALRARLELAADVPVVAIIARITPQKRLDLLLKALPEVVRRLPSLRVLVVGEAYREDLSYQAGLQAQLRHSGLEKVVRWHGFERDVTTIHAVSDALVVCNEAEPLGRSILEALAMAVPTVLPDRGGHLEIVKPGESAWVYKAGEPGSLAATLVSCLTQVEVSRRLAQAGMLVAKSLSIGAHADRINAIYGSLLAR